MKDSRWRRNVGSQGRGDERRRTRVAISCSTGIEQKFDGPGHNGTDLSNAAIGLDLWSGTSVLSVLLAQAGKGQREPGTSNVVLLPEMIQISHLAGIGAHHSAMINIARARCLLRGRGSVNHIQSQGPTRTSSDGNRS